LELSEQEREKRAHEIAILRDFRVSCHRDELLLLQILQMLTDCGMTRLINLTLEKHLATKIVVGYANHLVDFVVMPYKYWFKELI
jgi:hypothetical protein